MPMLLTRRQVLASGLVAAGTMPYVPTTRAAAAPEPATTKLRLTADTRTLVVNGKPALVFGLLGRTENLASRSRPAALSRRSRQPGRHAYHHPLARPIAALERGRLSSATNAADPC